MALAQLIYVSRRTKALTIPELERLTAQSATNNAARDITGVLLCGGSNLMQLLEGELGEITALFETIRQDPRHADVHCLLCKNIARRMFPEWGMGLADLDNRAPLNRGRLIALVDDVRATHNTSHHSVESRLLISDFKQQLLHAA